VTAAMAASRAAPRVRTNSTKPCTGAAPAIPLDADGRPTRQVCRVMVSIRLTAARGGCSDGVARVYLRRARLGLTPECTDATKRARRRQSISRKSGYRFSERKMRQTSNLERFPATVVGCTDLRNREALQAHAPKRQCRGARSANARSLPGMDLVRANGFALPDQAPARR